MKSRALKIGTAIIILLSLILLNAVYAVGDVVYINRQQLANNLEYVNTITWDTEAGRMESFAIRMGRKGDVHPIVLNGDTIYGGFSISRMVNYAESLGKNVLAVVNTDFFAQNTVPIGIVVEDGVYKSSSSARNAVTIGYDGSVDIIESPEVRIMLRNNGGAHDSSNSGKTVNLSNLNKQRSDTGGLLLLSEAFSTISTRTTSPGWFVRLKILEGELSVSGTMTLEVTETLTSNGAVPIGEGHLILTAADNVNLSEEYEKFAVGDRVTLTTTCTDRRLINAQYATGGGDILVSGGEKTDSDGWTPSLMPRAPRTALGISADGTVVTYVVDGRNSQHSVGMTMDELADEMIRQGFVYAINLDGGGSAALSVRLPGEEIATVVNRPSDGIERGCATYLLFVTDAESDGVADKLSLQNDGVIVLTESTTDIRFFATDRGFKPAPAPNDISVEATDPSAFVDGQQYTAGSVAGTDRLTLFSPSTGAHGTGEIYVISQPTSITVTRRGSTVPLTSVNITPGARLELDVTATYYRRSVIAQAHSFLYSVSGDIGEMIAPGVFRAGLNARQSGTITVSAGGRSVTIQVEISGFSDMENHWAREYAEYLLSAEVTRGVSSSMYGPSQQMKRGDFILMLYRAAGVSEINDSGSSAFDDVPTEMYYSQALTWARSTGIAEPLEGNNFFPQMPLSRQDAFTYTYRTLDILNKQYTDGTAEDLAKFPDAESVGDYAVIPTATLIRLGIVEGASGMLLPHSTMTRAQMAKVLAMTLQL